MDFRIGIRIFCKVDDVNMSKEEREKYPDFYCEEYIDSSNLWTYEEFVDKITKSIKKKERVNIFVPGEVEVVYCSLSYLGIEGKYSKEDYNDLVKEMKKLSKAGDLLETYYEKYPQARIYTKQEFSELMKDKKIEEIMKETGDNFNMSDDYFALNRDGKFRSMDTGEAEELMLIYIDKMLKELDINI